MRAPCASLGYGTPREDRVPIDLVYASRIYRIPARGPERTWKALLIYPIPPIDANAGLIFPLEGDRWMVTLPVYGQGMSASALAARALGGSLDRDRQAVDPRPFLRAQARIVAAPWLLATSEDFRYPHLAAQRPFWMPLLQLYTERVFRLATTRPAHYDRLLRVLHLVDRPARLFHPATMLAVAAAAFTAPVASRPERPE